jgi:hypothetical protein
MVESTVIEELPPPEGIFCNASYTAPEVTTALLFCVTVVSTATPETYLPNLIPFISSRTSPPPL